MSNFYPLVCVRYRYEAIHRRIPKCLTFTPSHRGGWWEALPNSTAVPTEDRHTGGLPLYRLTELLEAIGGNDREIWIVADERCVDAVLALPDTDFPRTERSPSHACLATTGENPDNATSRRCHRRMSTLCIILMVRPLNPLPEPLFIFGFNARAARLFENRIIMLRANYIHYIAIYSRFTPKSSNLWVVWVSFGRPLGAVWARANPLLLLLLLQICIYKGNQTVHRCHEYSRCLFTQRQ